MGRAHRTARQTRFTSGYPAYFRRIYANMETCSSHFSDRFEQYWLGTFPKHLGAECAQIFPAFEDRQKMIARDL